jgi:hypothetical protein
MVVVYSTMIILLMAIAKEITEVYTTVIRLASALNEINNACQRSH